MSSPAGGPKAAFRPAANSASGIGTNPTGRPARADSRAATSSPVGAVGPPILNTRPVTPSAVAAATAYSPWPKLRAQVRKRVLGCRSDPDSAPPASSDRGRRGGGERRMELGPSGNAGGQPEQGQLEVAATVVGSGGLCSRSQSSRCSTPTHAALLCQGQFACPLQNQTSVRMKVRIA